MMRSHKHCFYDFMQEKKSDYVTSFYLLLYMLFSEYMFKQRPVYLQNLPKCKLKIF